jgi:hypothetical protein
MFEGGIHHAEILLVQHTQPTNRIILTRYAPMVQTGKPPPLNLIDIMTHNLIPTILVVVLISLQESVEE